MAKHIKTPSSESLKHGPCQPLSVFQERGAPAALAEQLKTCSSGQDGNTDAEKKEAFEEPGSG